MKTIAILAMTIFFALEFVQTQAQETKNEVRTERKTLRKLEGTKVSELAKTNFYTDFGNAPDALWKRVDTFDQVTFTKDGKKMTAFYDFDANLVGTTSLKKFTDLPAKGQQEIKAKYKDYTVRTVIFFYDNQANETDMVLYGAQFDDADNYFVELTKGAEKIVVEVNPSGFVSLFKKL